MGDVKNTDGARCGARHDTRRLDDGEKEWGVRALFAEERGWR